MCFQFCTLVKTTGSKIRHTKETISGPRKIIWSPLGNPKTANANKDHKYFQMKWLMRSSIKKEARSKTDCFDPM